MEKIYNLISMFKIAEDDGLQSTILKKIIKEYTQMVSKNEDDDLDVDTIPSDIKNFMSIKNLKSLFDVVGYKCRNVILNLFMELYLNNGDVSDEDFELLENIISNNSNDTLREFRYLKLIKDAVIVPKLELKKIAENPNTELRIKALTLALETFFEDKDTILSIFENDKNPTVQNLLEIYKEPANILVSETVNNKTKERMLSTLFYTLNPEELSDILLKVFNNANETVSLFILKKIMKLPIYNRITDVLVQVFKGTNFDNVTNFHFELFKSIMKAHSSYLTDDAIVSSKYAELIEVSDLFTKAKTPSQYKALLSHINSLIIEQHEDIQDFIESWLNSNDTEMISVVFPIILKYKTLHSIVDDSLVEGWLTGTSDVLRNFALKWIKKMYNDRDLPVVLYERVLKVLNDSNAKNTFKTNAFSIIKLKVNMFKFNEVSEIIANINNFATYEVVNKGLKPIYKKIASELKMKPETTALLTLNVELKKAMEDKKIDLYNEYRNAIPVVD